MKLINIIVLVIFVVLVITIYYTTTSDQPHFTIVKIDSNTTTPASLPANSSNYEDTSSKSPDTGF